MGQNSAIEWTDHTFNPWWGCEKVSEACRFCYAEAGSKRHGHNVWGAHAPRRFFGDDHWREPVKWNKKAEKAGKPAFVFCASYADVCELLPEAHPDADKMELERNRLRHLIRETPWLTWLLLTKRPQSFGLLIPPFENFWPPNAWAGVTAENQEQADLRIPELLKVAAPRRFISYEPALGTLDLSPWLDELVERDNGEPFYRHSKTCQGLCDYGCNATALEAADRATFHWLICGGESDPSHGKRARPMHPAWARAARDQCQAAGVPFFFKQWGDYEPFEFARLKIGAAQIPAHVEFPDGTKTMHVGKKSAGRLLDGREWNEHPAPLVPEGSIARA